MARSMKELLKSMDDAALGAHCRDRYERLLSAFDMGIGPDPSVGYNEQNKTLRDHYRATRDGAGSGLGARELEERDAPRVQDDPGFTPNAAALPERNGAALAAHDSLEEFRIRQRAGYDMEGELHLARIRRANPAHVAAMTAAIPGFGRIK